MVTRIINTPQGWTQFRPPVGQSWDILDCEGGSWNCRNSPPDPQLKYPVYIEGNTVQIDIINGVINGTTDQTTNWGALYTQQPGSISGNSTGVFVKNCPSGSSVQNWYFYHTWDAVRFRGTPNFLVKNVHSDGTRDDGAEFDDGNGGLLEHCLFENCFGGVSVADKNAFYPPVNTITLRDVHIHHANYPVTRQNGTQAISHTSPLKGSSNDSGQNVTPTLVLENSTIAIADVAHEGIPRFTSCLGRINNTLSHDNFFLNLTDNPLPGTYPARPASFTTLNGAAARLKWAEIRAAYFAGPVEPPVEVAGITNAISINPTSGVIATLTDDLFPATTITVRATNAVGSSFGALAISVVAP